MKMNHWLYIYLSVLIEMNNIIDSKKFKKNWIVGLNVMAGGKKWSWPIPGQNGKVPVPVIFFGCYIGLGQLLTEIH